MSPPHPAPRRALPRALYEALGLLVLGLLLALLMLQHLDSPGSGRVCGDEGRQASAVAGSG